MKKYEQDKPLISIHVPKCAGTSFIHVLKKWYQRRLLMHYPDERRGKRPKKHNLNSSWSWGKGRKNKCVHGHFNWERGYGAKDYYPEVNQFITILRDPFDLHMSNFRFLKSLKEKAYRDGSRSKESTDSRYDLEKYLEETRSFMLAFMPKRINMENYRDVLGSEFIYMGIVEDIQVSVDVLADKLGFQTVKIPKNNVSTHLEKIPAGAREKFMSEHPVEYAIYNHALENYK